MDQGNHSEEDGSGKSSSLEEDDTIDMPSHSKVFVPSKEQAVLWELFLKRWVVWSQGVVKGPDKQIYQEDDQP